MNEETEMMEKRHQIANEHYIYYIIWYDMLNVQMLCILR